jgi:hypothetical protein
LAGGADQPAPDPQTPRGGLLNILEHPLVLLILLSVGGLVGVIYFTPALVICEAAILLALHGSKILNGRATAIQAVVYGILFLATGSALVGLSFVARQPARDYLHDMASHPAVPAAPGANAAARPASNPIPPSGGFFTFPAGIPDAQSSPANNHRQELPAPPPPPQDTGPVGELMREMRAKLSRDAGDPDKVGQDVEWMREQFAAGWATESPDLASRHREETEQTARLILANASNRNAVLQLIPHITIDAASK